MPYSDGIPRIRSFSLGDFHDFERCHFKFLVSHHLEKKYELSETNRQAALGSLLDQAIKHFHKTRMNGCPPEELEKAVRMGASFIRGKIGNGGKPSFYSGIGDYLDEELILKATQVFQDYYQSRGQKIYPSVFEKEFCDLVIEGEDGPYKLWGGPDAYELSPDNVVEVVDYKYRSDFEKGKGKTDMDLMPKIYILLASKDLLSRGFNKARFVVRFWQDPGDISYFEEFDLGTIDDLKDFFKIKMQKILGIEGVTFCEQGWCKACSSEKRQEFLKELQERGFIKMSGEEFLRKIDNS